MTDYIEHHGILGMKWGIRRYQNPDGSLTEAGKRRYLNGDKSQSDKKHPNNEHNDADHSKSNKSELVKFMALLAWDVVRLNPVGLTMDVARGAAAVASTIKNHSFMNERKEEKTDPKTGLYLKSQDLNETQDLRRVNPLRYNFDANTKNNCVLCTAAYDMRRRGFDVQANKASYGYDLDAIKMWYPKAKVTVIKGYHNGNEKGRKATQNMARQMVRELSSQGDGARGQIAYLFKNSRGGHSVAYEVVNGQVIIRDPQIAKSYYDAEKYLSDSSHGSMAIYARLDDVQFDPKRIKEAVS